MKASSWTELRWEDHWASRVLQTYDIGNFCQVFKKGPTNMQSNTQNILAIGIFCQQLYQLPHVVEQVPVENFTVLLADAPNSIYVQKI